MEPPIRLAFSPDSDDIFMFWPLLHGKVDTEGLSFTYERADTEALNLRAEREDIDVLAVSIARYASLRERWLLLPHGASIGRGYGPVLVSTRPKTLEELAGARLGVPGLHTTAYFVLRLLLPRFDAVVVPIAPYTRAFEAVRRGEVAAVLLIHEGRLLYEQEGLHKVVDVGEAWAEKTGGLPLPLGGNVIRRALGVERVAKVSRLCRASIAWSLEHREEVMTELLAGENRDGLAMGRAHLDRYLSMYANADSLGFAPDARQAIDELFRRASAAGLVSGDPRAEFAP
jgi:1,4-dihydroxy-6-naphthoate synthase